MGLFAAFRSILSPSPPTLAKTAGSPADIERQLRRLCDSTDPRAFLAIEVAGSPWFVQLTAGKGGLGLSWPLITDWQKEREPRVRRFCEAAGLRLRAEFGSNGAQFLDCEFPRDPSRAAPVLAQLIAAAFDNPSVLHFDGDGLAPIAV